MFTTATALDWGRTRPKENEFEFCLFWWWDFVRRKKKSNCQNGIAYKSIIASDVRRCMMNIWINLIRIEILNKPPRPQPICSISIALEFRGEKYVDSACRQCTSTCVHIDEWVMVTSARWPLQKQFYVNWNTRNCLRSFCIHLRPHHHSVCMPAPVTSSLLLR